jgi:prevent-host-death family protein
MTDDAKPDNDEEPIEVAVAVSLAKGQISDLVSKAEYLGQRTIITRHGKTIAAIIPMSDLYTLTGEVKQGSGERE